MNFHGLDFVEADLVNSFNQAEQLVANCRHHVITETAALAFYIVRNLEIPSITFLRSPNA